MPVCSLCTNRATEISVQSSSVHLCCFVRALTPRQHASSVRDARRIFLYHITSEWRRTTDGVYTSPPNKWMY